MSAEIYYFSATGNSFDVAREIAEKITAKLTPLVPLAGQETAAQADTVGIVFPVYHWNIPQVVRDFVTRLDLTQAEYLFAVATCNFLPGCSLDAVGQLLVQKGKKLNAGFAVLMPGTYLPSRGANPSWMQKLKYEQKNKKTERIARTVLGGKNHRNEHSPLVFDRLKGPKYEAEIRAFADKDNNFTLEPGCSGCGICAKVCPFNNIDITEGKPEWQHKCQQCLACVHYCPNEYIQIGEKTKGRTRYKNPVVSLKEIMSMNNKA